VSVPLPPFLHNFDATSPLNQREPWRYNAQWQTFLAGHPHVAHNLQAEIAAHEGIRRSYLMSLATGNVEDFFLSVMAWGFATSNVHYPAQVALMTPPFDKANLQKIVNDTRNLGALAGWKAMMETNSIYGLGYGFGTKLLYFAGYGVVPQGPQPLILDNNVMKALARKVPGLTWDSDYNYANSRNYLRYLQLAQQWASDPQWNGSPEAVEFALWSEGRGLK
jgi:hypothetical protein